MLISRLFIGLCLSLLATIPAIAQQADTQQHILNDLVQQHLTYPQAGAVLAIVSPTQIETVYSGSLQANSILPLGHLGELFGAVLLQQLLAEQKLKLSDPVNYHLEGLRLDETQGEITLQDLLQRSSGLAWRQSGLYLDNSKHELELKTLLEQELKPPVMTPGRAITVHSAGDLVIGQLVASQYRQALPKLIKEKLIAPLHLDSIQLGAAQALPRYASGYDSQGLPWPILWASAREIQGYQGQTPDLAKFWQALIQPQSPLLAKSQQQALFQKSLTPDSDLPTSSQGLLMSSWGGQDFFYLDSDLFGYSLRLAYFPQFKRGFVLAYNQSSPGLKEALTEAFIQQMSPAKALSSPPAERSQTSQRSFVKLASHDQYSLLKVLELFSLQTYQWGSQNGLLQAEFAGVAYKGQPGQAVLSNQNGQKIAFQPGQNDLLIGFGDQRAYELVPIWRRSLDWAFALLCLGLFLSILLRAVRFLWAYEPQLDYSEPGTTETAVHAPQPPEITASPVASWDIPVLAAFSSGCAALFLLSFYPVLFWVSRVGDQLSTVVRNAPGGILIILLILPLLALVSGLILSLLLANEWRARPWTAGERLHYLSYLPLLFIWLGWLTHWNLLGFNF